MSPKITKQLSPNKKLNKTKENVSRNQRAKSPPKSKTDKVSKYVKVNKTDKADNPLPAKTDKIDTTIAKSGIDLTTIIKPPESQPNQSDISKETVTEIKKSPDPVPTKKIRIQDLSADDALKRAIAEIESEGSSNASSDYGQYYYQQSQEEEEEDNYILNDPHKFLEVDIISEDESSIYEEPDYVKQNELEMEMDFFGDFGNMPQVDEVSVDPTLDLIHNIPTEIEEIETVSLDIGKFVNPLTGISSSSLTTKSSKEENQEMQQEELQQLEEQQQQLSDHSDDIVSTTELKEPEQDPEVLTQPRDDDEAATFDQFLTLQTERKRQTQDIPKMLDNIREELDQQNLQYCKEFINKLIDRCIDRSEYIDSNIILQRNIDKRKLLQELKIKLSSSAVENSVKQFLNRKCVEHFRRKRTFRPIMNDNPNTISQDIEKFYTACSDLDKWLIKEEHLKSTNTSNLENLKEKFKTAEDRTIEEIMKFENLLRESFKRDNFDKLQISVNNSITKMSVVRKEISQIRFRLILQQHKEAMLVEQLRDLEDLGNGLSMRNFENMQTETQALGKKIEERNAELKKLHFRCNTDIHNMAHLKEKQKMLHHTISIQKKYLEDCLNDKKYLRDTIHQLKLNRNRIRYEIRDLSFQGGLLDKPVLMRDYDQTTAIVEKLQQKVDGLKMTVNRLNTKIALVEEINCKRKS